MPPNADVVALLQRHPLPWRIVDDGHFSEGTPLTVLDARGAAILAIAGSASPEEPTPPEDWAIARGLVALAAAAS